MYNCAFFLAIIVWAAALIQATPVRRQSLSGYAPVPAACPANIPLVRQATGVGAAESAFIARRYPIASQNLAAWLATTLNGTCSASSSDRKRSVTPNSKCAPAKAAIPPPNCQGANCAEIWSIPIASGNSQETGAPVLSWTSPATSRGPWTTASTVSSPSTSPTISGSWPTTTASLGWSSGTNNIWSTTSSSTTSSSTSSTCSPESFQPTKYPLVGLTTSGGGYRSLLTGAGVIQAFDIRDSQTGVSGVFQGLTYEAGLSGGAWFLSSFAANNWPTISSLQTGLWEQAFQDSLLIPGNLLTAGPDYTVSLVTLDNPYSNIAPDFAIIWSDGNDSEEQVTIDIAAKQAAGFPPTLTDPWGRLLSYQLLYGPDGGVADTDSGLATLSNFTSHNIPYPIITALGVQVEEGECTPPANATQYEIHPYEFGSWDAGVDAFTLTKYLGSSLTAGHPTVPGACITNYDNQGYVLGTSSNLFNEACVPLPGINSTDDTFTALAEDLAAIIDTVHEVTTRDNYAVYPNPFYEYGPSTLVADQTSLYLVDGGEALQNNPIWPFLHRPLVDVLIVNDNSADTATNYPNGSEIYTTYLLSQAEGLTRMPVIPDADTFVADGLNLSPTFFGCDDPDVITIVYLPNQEYTYDSGQPTTKLEYTTTETDEMIANGNQIATQGGDAGWPLCLACGIMKKAGGTLPSGCADCYTEYCYN